jgi:Predicted membrane protein (DUF2127)
LKRPIGITILAFIAFVIAAFFALWAFRAIVGGYIVANAFRSPLVPNAAGSMVSYFGIVVGMSAFLFAIDGVALWKLKEWGRLLTFGLVGISLVFDLIGTVTSLVNFRIFVMMFWLTFAGIDAFLLWYLSQPSVKIAFGGSLQSKS